MVAAGHPALKGCRMLRIHDADHIPGSLDKFLELGRRLLEPFSVRGGIGDDLNGPVLVGASDDNGRARLGCGARGYTGDVVSYALPRGVPPHCVFNARALAVGSSPVGVLRVVGGLGTGAQLAEELLEGKRAVGDGVSWRRHYYSVWLSSRDGRVGPTLM